MELTGKSVLLTGGTGFIGNHVLKRLLEKGAHVRAVVRSAAKGQVLKSIAPIFNENLEIRIVENIEIEGAYDEVIQGTEIIVHMASPLPSSTTIDNEQGLLLPARNGVINMLKSASKASSVKRVVVTSSSASVVDKTVPTTQSRIWTEEDWSEVTWEEGVKGDPGTAYRASKKFAEKAAWKFMEKEKPQFSLITLCAPGVFGQPVLRPSSLSEISGSNRPLLIVFDPHTPDIPKTWSAFYIDVRDMAEAHVLAAGAPDSATNQRYLIAGPGVATNKMIREFLTEIYPERVIAPLSKEAEEEVNLQIFDASKMEKTFNMKFRSMEELLKDYAPFVFSYER